MFRNVMIRKYLKRYDNLSVQLKASLWFLACSFLQRGISMLTTPIFTRLLDSCEYGQYNVFNSWLGILTIIISLNLSAGVYTQGLIKFDRERSLFASSLQGLNTFLTVVWLFIYLLFHDFWNNIINLSTGQMLLLIFTIFANSIFSFWASEQRVLYRYKALVAVTLFVSFSGSLLGIIFIHYFRNKVTGRILGMLVIELFVYIFLYVAQLRRGRKLYSRYFWKYALMYNIPLVPHYLSQTVLSSADRIMINKMDSSSHAGIYSLAYSISMIMTVFNTALMHALAPWIFQKIKERRNQDIAFVAYLSLMLIAVVNIILILLAPEIVAIFAPPEYSEAIWIVPPVALSVYFMYCYDLFAKFAFYYEKTKFIMIASMLGAVLNVILNYFCIRRFGYIAAGYTTLICYIIYCCAHFYFMNKVCDEQGENQRAYNKKIILFISTIFVVFGMSLIITYHYVVVRYVLLIAILIALFCNRKKIIRFYKKIERAEVIRRPAMKSQA